MTFNHGPKPPGSPGTLSQETWMTNCSNVLKTPSLLTPRPAGEFCHGGLSTDHASQRFWLYATRQTSHLERLSIKHSFTCPCSSRSSILLREGCRWPSSRCYRCYWEGKTKTSSLASVSPSRRSPLVEGEKIQLLIPFHLPLRYQKLPYLIGQTLSVG